MELIEDFYKIKKSFQDSEIKKKEVKYEFGGWKKIKFLLLKNGNLYIYNNIDFKCYLLKAYYIWFTTNDNVLNLHYKDNKNTPNIFNNQQIVYFEQNYSKYANIVDLRINIYSCDGYEGFTIYIYEEEEKCISCGK